MSSSRALHFIFQLHLFVCVHTCQGICVMVKGQLAGIGSILPLCGLQGLNTGDQAWCPLPAKPSLWPSTLIFETRSLTEHEVHHFK